MLKKAYAERVMVTDGGWVSLDAGDLTVFESVYKKNLREGEERLMLAVLESAVNISRSISLHGTRVKRSYFERRRSGF